MDFFYDGQIRRYLVQFIRTFSDVKIESGNNDEGTLVQTRVPIMYGDPSWLVSNLLKGGSENTLMPSPLMSAWIVSLEQAPERRLDPARESSVNAIERNYSETDGYGTEIGNRYTIDRYMPVPYTLTLQLDVWTTTTTTKLQILEQLLTIFNPMVQLQQNSNKFDWSSIFELELINVTWSNRGVPQGSSLERDIASLQFKLPIWINPPAKLKHIKIIEQVVTNFHTAADLTDEEIDRNIYDPFSCIGEQIGQCIVTPGNFQAGVGTHGVANNEVILLNKHGAPDPSLSWKSLFESYGNLQENITCLRLKLDSDIEDDTNDILGTVAYDASRPNVLIFDVDIDTLPTTIPAIDAVIDPHKKLPGKELPVAAPGQRYLLISDLTDGEEPAIPDAIDSPWGIVRANENDIIEYDGTRWFVSFDSESQTESVNVVSNSTGDYYQYNSDGWSFTYIGDYFPGYWRLENVAVKESSGNNPLETSPSDEC